jgi:hypothetical protein
MSTTYVYLITLFGVIAITALVTYIEAHREAKRMRRSELPPRRRPF